MELWNRNVYTDLNGKQQNLETKQITKHVFSYMFLTSVVICVFSSPELKTAYGFRADWIKTLFCMATESPY